MIPGEGWPDSASGRSQSRTRESSTSCSGRSQNSIRIFTGTISNPESAEPTRLTKKTVVRAGVGRFITRLGVSDSGFLGGNPPLRANGLHLQRVGRQPRRRNQSRFPLNVTTQDPIFKNPQAWIGNFTVEREVGFNTTVEGFFSYVGRRGLHGQRERNINQLHHGTLQANPGVNPDFLRPYKGFGPIRITNNDANSTYNGFQVGVNARFSDGLSFGAAYTTVESV